MDEDGISRMFENWGTNVGDSRYKIQPEYEYCCVAVFLTRCGNRNLLDVTKATAPRWTETILDIS